MCRNLTGLSRSKSWSSFLFGLGFLVGKESIPHMSAFAPFSLSLDTIEDVIGEVDELEEDAG